MTYSVAIIKGVALLHLTPAMPARLWLVLARFVCVVQEKPRPRPRRAFAKAHSGPSGLLRHPYLRFKRLLEQAGNNPHLLVKTL